MVLKLLDEKLAEITEGGMRYQVIKGVRYLVEVKTNEVLLLNESAEPGSAIGTLNEETGEIEAM
jgi:hypothetical protein